MKTLLTIALLAASILGASAQSYRFTDQYGNTQGYYQQNGSNGWRVTDQYGNTRGYYQRH